MEFKKKLKQRLYIAVSYIVIGFVLSLLGKHDAAQSFSWFVCGQVSLYWICWLILRKKY